MNIQITHDDTLLIFAMNNMSGKAGYNARSIKRTDIMSVTNNTKEGCVYLGIRTGEVIKLSMNRYLVVDTVDGVTPADNAELEQVLSALII